MSQRFDSFGKRDIWRGVYMAWDQSKVTLGIQTDIQTLASLEFIGADEGSNVWADILKVSQ